METISALLSPRGGNLDEIGREFNMSRFGSVSSVVERMGGKIPGDRQLRTCVEEIKTVLQMRQAQTLLFYWPYAARRSTDQGSIRTTIKPSSSEISWPSETAPVRVPKMGVQSHFAHHQDPGRSRKNRNSLAAARPEAL